MDNTLQDLKESIYFHLTANEDKPISLHSMWNQMLSPIGWRCSELTINKKDLFIAEFHSVPNEFKDVCKFYKNGIPYLVYTRKSLTKFDSVSETTETSCCSLEELIDSYIKGKITITSDFVESIIKMDNTNYVKKILDNVFYEQAGYEYLLSKSNSTEMTNLLLKKKYDAKINELNNTIDNLQQVNRTLENRYSESLVRINSLELTVKDLEIDVRTQLQMYEDNKQYYSRFIVILMIGYILRFFNIY